MLSPLRREAQQVANELSRKKDLLELILTKKLREIDGQRRELDSLEHTAEEMLKEDQEDQILASANLEPTISAQEAI